MTLKQISMTKLKSRYKHKKCRTFCVLRAYAGLYCQRLSLKKHNYFKLGVNEHVIITHFHDFSQTFIRVLTHVDQWNSRTLNQMSMTKLKSGCEHENFLKM